jgi:hypothetical protein
MAADSDLSGRAFEGLPQRKERSAKSVSALEEAACDLEIPLR